MHEPAWLQSCPDVENGSGYVASPCSAHRLLLKDVARMARLAHMSLFVQLNQATVAASVSVR